MPQLTSDVVNFWLAVLVVALIPFAVVLLIWGPAYWSRRRTIAATLRVLQDLLEGRTDSRVDPTKTGILGRLARSVNQLAANIDEQKAQHEQDRENLRSLLEHTDEVVLATDAQDHIQLVNPAATRMLERSEAQLLGQALTAVLSHRELLKLYKSAFASPSPVAGEIRFPAGRKMVQCHVTATTMHTAGRFRGTLLLLRDLTEISQAFQMKTDFVANASHELRTPLASIRAAVETIQECLNDDGIELGADGDTVRRCSDIIAAHVLRLQMMVQDLLDLSRTEDPRAVVRMEQVDLQHACDMVLGIYGALATEKKVALHIALANDARSFRGDERLLILTLKNLVDNSLKFTPPGGTITVRSYAAAGQTEDYAKDAIVVAVEDTGCGIPPEDQQRVFERFYTVNRSRGGADRGTGLGLAIVKHAVSAMNGTVQLESRLHEGTTVRCIFPARSPEPLPV